LRPTIAVDLAAMATDHFPEPVTAAGGTTTLAAPRIKGWSDLYRLKRRLGRNMPIPVYRATGTPASARATA
jgi:hypothetical protein